MHYFEGEVSKILKKSNFVVFKPGLLLEITKKARDLEIVTSSFSRCQNVQKFSFVRTLAPGRL